MTNKTALFAAGCELLARQHLDLHDDDRAMLQEGVEAARGLAVEVSAVRGLGGLDGVDTCNDDPSAAEAFAVYIRNPLAFHVEDFAPTVHPGSSAPAANKAASMAKAKARAFTFADALAEHLGCSVESPLKRDPAPVSRFDEIEAAACLWEAALVLLAEPEDERTRAGKVLATMKEEEGASVTRLTVIGWAVECHRAWEAAGGHDRDDCFDWDFAPAWLVERLEQESACGQCEGTGRTDAMGHDEECPVCDGSGVLPE